MLDKKHDTVGTYLVIGASSGIGKEITQQLSQKHRVIGTFNSTPVSNSAHVNYHQLDVLSSTKNLDFIPDVLDGLVYCPGSINLKPFKRFKKEEFLSDFSLQVGGAIELIQASLSALKKGNNPSIILFSSVAAQNGFNFHTQVSTSKGAIEGLSKALAAELAPTIRVNTIAPSLTHTPLADALLNTDAKIEANAERHPLKSIGSAQDIAHLACFLLSEEAKWITGQIHHIDGGISTIK